MEEYDPRPDVIYRVKLAPGGEGEGAGRPPASIVFSIQMLNVKMTFTISRKWWNGPRCRLGGHLRGCSFDDRRYSRSGNDTSRGIHQA